MLKCKLAKLRIVTAFHTCLIRSTVFIWAYTASKRRTVIHPCTDLDDIYAKGIRAGGGINCTLYTQSKTVMHAWVEPRSWR